MKKGDIGRTSDVSCLVSYPSARHGRVAGAARVLFRCTEVGPLHLVTVPASPVGAVGLRAAGCRCCCYWLSWVRLGPGWLFDLFFLLLCAMRLLSLSAFCESAPSKVHDGFSSSPVDLSEAGHSRIVREAGKRLHAEQ